MKTIYTLVIFILSVVNIAFAQWPVEFSITHPVRNNTNLIREWHGTSKIKGFLLAGSIGNAHKFSTNSTVRNYLKKNELGILYIRTQGLGMSVFDYTKDADFFNQILAEVAKKSGVAEYKNAPWVVFGHSTDGLFAQNIALWNPDKTMGIIHYKSGNLGNPKHLFSPYTTLDPLKNIPFLSICGRHEQYGPNGNLKPGQSTQTQWFAAKDTLMKLREIDYPVNMILDYFGDANHDSFSQQSATFGAKFIEEAAKAQLTDNYPSNNPIKLKRVDPKMGWLTDTSLSKLIDSPELPEPYLEGSYSDFPSAKRMNASFWHFNRNMAVEWINYHHSKYGNYESPLAFNEHIEEGLQISVNHEKNQIKIKGLPENFKGSIVLSNLIGNIVFKAMLIRNDIISIPSLQESLYFLTVYDEQKPLLTKKIILKNN